MKISYKEIMGEENVCSRTTEVSFKKFFQNFWKGARSVPSSKPPRYPKNSNKPPAYMVNKLINNKGEVIAIKYQLVCPICHKPVRRIDKFCSECGNNLVKKDIE